MKKLLIMMLVVFMSLSLIACTAPQEAEAPNETAGGSEPPPSPTTHINQEGDKKLRFALMHGDQGTWQVYMRDYTQIACDELGIELLVYCGDNDGSKNITDLQTVIELGVDGVLLDPVDTATDLKMKEMLNEAKIPFICFDRSSSENAGEGMNIAFVGQDDVQAGYDLGKYLIEDLKVTKILEIDGNMSSEPGVNRKTGFNKILEEHPEVELLGAQAADWQLDLGMNVAQDLLNAHPDGQAIWCGNDDMALGALAAAQALGFDDLIIGAMDCSDAGLENIIEGGAFKVSVGAHFVCGPIAAISLYDYLHGEKIEPMITFNMLKVDGENAEKFLKINSQFGLIKGRCAELSKHLNPNASDDRWISLLSPYAS